MLTAFAAALGAQATALASSTGVVTWYCPAAMAPDHRVRGDYVASLTRNENWKPIASDIQVLKFFVESLLPSPDHLGDDDIAALVGVCNKYKFATAFEVGGLRMNAAHHGPGSGRRYAQTEIRLLRRWQAAGGEISFITTDNAVMNTISRLYQRKPSELGAGYTPSLSEIIEEACVATAMLSAAFPNAHVGAIETLSFFDVLTPEKGFLHNLDPTLVPKIPFREFLDEWTQAMTYAGCKLDHFHIDFGYEAVMSDGRGAKLEFARVAAAVQQLKEFSLNAGIIVCAFDDFTLHHIKPNSRQLANQSAIKNTLDYLAAVMNTMIPFRDILFERWEPYPDVTGDSTNDLSDMGLTHKLLLEWRRSVQR